MDQSSEQSTICNVMDLIANNKLFVCMMLCAALDAFLNAIISLLVGPYLKDNYKLNPFQLGIYVTVSIGTAEIISNLVIAPYVVHKSRYHILILIGCLIEFFGVVCWNVLHILSQ